MQPHRRQLRFTRLTIPAGIAFAVLASANGCARIEVAPIEVKPIHITMDINLRIDRSLDEFFSFQPAAGSGPAVIVPPPTTLPSRETP